MWLISGKQFRFQSNVSILRKYKITTLHNTIFFFAQPVGGKTQRQKNSINMLHCIYVIVNYSFSPLLKFTFNWMLYQSKMITAQLAEPYVERPTNVILDRFLYLSWSDRTGRISRLIEIEIFICCINLRPVDQTGPNINDLNFFWNCNHFSNFKINWRAIRHQEFYKTN